MEGTTQDLIRDKLYEQLPADVIDGVHVDGLAAEIEAALCAPDDKRERSTDALDHEDLILVLHVIDFALEHDRLARQYFGAEAALTTESRIGINSLRAKIRAAL